jgi:hypothetical protein
MMQSSLARLRVEIRAIADLLLTDRWLLLTLFLIQLVAYSFCIQPLLSVSISSPMPG